MRRTPVSFLATILMRGLAIAAGRRSATMNFPTRSARVETRRRAIWGTLFLAMAEHETVADILPATGQLRDTAEGAGRCGPFWPLANDVASKGGSRRVAPRSQTAQLPNAATAHT